MIDAYELYKDVLDMVSQEDNGQLQSNRFNRLANRAGLRLLNELVANQTDPRLRNFLQSVEDVLSPFIVAQPVHAVDGIVVKPVDYAFYKSMRVDYDGNNDNRVLAELYGQLCKAKEDPTINVMEIEDQIKETVSAANFVDVQLMPSHKLATRARSYIPNKRPSPKKPVTEFVNDGFRVYPRVSGTVWLTYYRNPVPGKVVMTENPQTLDIEYNPAQSVPFEWPQQARELLILYVAEQYGVSKRERDLFQMVDALKQRQQP